MFITLRFKILPKNNKDKQMILNLMRAYSSCHRFAYKRLLENYKENEIYKLAREKFKDLPTLFILSAVSEAKELLKSKKLLGEDPRKVVFGGKRLFTQLCIHHLQGWRLEEVKREWREKRKGNLLSIGHNKYGNPNMKFVFKEDKMLLRITSYERGKPIYAEIKRKVKSKKDKWTNFICPLLENQKFPYTIRLKLKNNKIYGYVSFEIQEPKIKITKENGVIGIDINAKPFHLAIAEINKDGNLISYKRIKLGHLNNFSKNRKEYEEWLIAHKIINLAKEKNKAIVIENINNLPKGKRGDGKRN
jgi:predicted transposase